MAGSTPVPPRVLPRLATVRATTEENTMKVRFRRAAVLPLALAAALAVAAPAMAQSGTGGGGGGGGATTGGVGGGGGGGGGGRATAPPAPAASCAHIVSAIVDPNPPPIDPNPVFPAPIVVQVGAPVGPSVALDFTIDNQCVDEVGAGPKGSVAVAITTVDTATGARLATGITMQPAFALMTWRYWSPVPTADTVVPDHTQVIWVTKANGRVQDTLTYTAAAMNRATVTAVTTGVPQSLR